MIRSTALICVAMVCGAALDAQTGGPQDAVLQAMRDELKHSRALEKVNLEKAYFISYEMEDGEILAASAVMGGLVSSTNTPFRVPRIQVRVGDYQFDNTNYVGSGFSFGSRYDIDRFPIEDLYAVLRRFLWLATDQGYKAAVEAINRKRAALKNMTAGEEIPDFAKAEPVRHIETAPASLPDPQAWLARVRTLSAIFTEFPRVLSSNVELQAIKNVRRLATSEGTEVRTPEDLMFVRVRGVGQAPDGMQVRDSVVFHTHRFERMPAEAELAREVRRVAENITALSAAEVGDIYNGPVLFEGVASAQLFAQLLGRNLVLTRKPVNEPGRPSGFPMSELEGRKESRVLPEWMDVVDDPTQAEWRGRPLFGNYKVDYEGVPAKPLAIVEKGMLLNFLLTRQPVRGFAASNGRARLPGAFGANTAAISNLLVRASQTAPLADLRKKLMEICQARNQKYGIVVRKLDFPSSASIDELRRLMATNSRDGGSSHPSAVPLLIYKVFPDGKEELIRGVRFRDLNVRSLRDIRAAGNDTAVLDYLENAAPLAVMGAGNYAAECSVVAPSVLVDDMEIRKLDEEHPKLPIVPPPLGIAGK